MAKNKLTPKKTLSILNEASALTRKADKLDNSKTTDPAVTRIKDATITALRDKAEYLLKLLEQQMKTESPHAVNGQPNV